MDLKTALQGGGLGGAVIAALYVCGWQYYLALFHTLGLDIYFFIPIQIGLGAGVEPVVTLLVMPGVVAAICGRAAAKLAGQRRHGTLVLCLLSIMSGFFLPVFIAWASGSWMALSLDFGRWLEFAAFGIGIGGLAFLLAFRFEKRSAPSYRWYVVSAVILLLAASAQYGDIRGRAAAHASMSQKLARLILSDPTLQRTYSEVLVEPMLEIDDYLVFVQFEPKDLDQQSSGPRHKMSDGQIAFVRKSLIQAIEYEKK